MSEPQSIRVEPLEVVPTLRADMSVSDLEALRTEIRRLLELSTTEIVSLSNQLDRARADREATGRRAKNDWERRLSSRLAHRRSYVQRLNVALGEANRALRRHVAMEASHTAERAFIEVVRERLGVVEYASIWDEARRRAGGTA